MKIDLLESFACEIEEALKIFDDSEEVAEMLYEEGRIDSYAACEGATHIRGQRLAMLELQRKFSDLMREISDSQAESNREPAKNSADTPLSETTLTMRTQNILLENGVESVRDLLKVSDIALLKMPRLGKKSLAEIRIFTKPHLETSTQ